MKVSEGCIVKIDFELKVKGGDVIESSAKTGPIQYVHGQGKMLPGFEKQLEGMTIGEEKRGTIPAAEAFGPEESLPTKTIPRKEFPADLPIEVGTIFQAKDPTGAPISFKAVALTDDTVTVRFLHPLAGKDLEYRAKILMIDDPKSKRRAVSIPPPPADALLDDD